MMKSVLFCNLPYAFGILKPLAKALQQKGFTYIWYVPKEIEDSFDIDDKYTTSIKELEEFQSDAIFVPGNSVPYWLRGVKVQVFHGLAGEKKGHFRIRDYFDLYLTQGPYFTDRFNQLKQKHKNFEVTQTGWCKLDNLFVTSDKTLQSKNKLLQDTQANNIILYAPTFSPSLTSAYKLQEHILKLSQEENNIVIIKFHDKTAQDIVESYQQIQNDKLIILTDKDITPALQMADLMISDTSSVVYEFLLLNKPVITLNSHSEHINWADFQSVDLLYQEAIDTLRGIDRYKSQRDKVISLYHPYSDGKSSYRMIDATQQYISSFGIPTKRKLPLLRKLKNLKEYR